MLKLPMISEQPMHGDDGTVFRMSKAERSHEACAS